MEKVTLLLILLLCVGFLSAQVPTSVRNQSLGGVIDGEWDNIYDPINLRFYDQTYYFTNLSDMVQNVKLINDEYTYLQESEFLSEYPFGLSFKNPFWSEMKHAFLIRYKDNNIPGFMDGIGEQENYTTNYWDIDGDGTYDRREYMHNIESDYNDIGKRLLLLMNSSMPLGESTLGFRLSYDNKDDCNDNALMSYAALIDDGTYGSIGAGANSGSSHYEAYSLDENLLLNTHDESGSFDTTTDSNNLNLLLSLMKPTEFLSDNSELRFDLAVDYNSVNRIKTHDNYQGEHYQYYDEYTDRNTSFSTTYQMDYEAPATELILSAGYRHNLDADPRRDKQAFWELGVGIGGMTGSLTENYVTTESSMEEETDILDVYTEEYSGLMEYIMDGSQSGIKAKLAARGNLNLNENICFAYGAKFSWLSKKASGDYLARVHKVYTQTTGNSFNDAEDLRLTENYMLSTEFESVDNVLTTTLPVALEFSLPRSSLTDHDGFAWRNFSFRLGTVFQHKSRDYDISYKEHELEVESSILVDGLGVVVDEEHDSENSLTQYREASQERSGRKFYTAGLGYQHSDNLNIDLGGWMDSDAEEYYMGVMFTLKK